MRLDHFLTNSDLLITHIERQITDLGYNGSDHKMILLTFSSPILRSNSVKPLPPERVYAVDPLTMPKTPETEDEKVCVLWDPDPTFYKCPIWNPAPTLLKNVRHEVYEHCVAVDATFKAA